MSTVPGVTPITMKSLPPGANSPGQAAIMNMNASNQKLANLTSIGGRKRRGGGDSIPVPQFTPLYQSQGGPGTSPNEQIASITGNSAQASAWSANDNAALKMGGKRRSRRRSINKRSKRNKRSRKSRKYKR